MNEVAAAAQPSLGGRSVKGSKSAFSIQKRRNRKICGAVMRLG
jgi:hypothetical protein